MHPLLSQGVRLTWSADRRITGATGATELVLQLTAEGLVGQLLEAALDVPPERAAALDVRARAEGGVDFVPRESVPKPADGESRLAHAEAPRTWLRLELGCEAGVPFALVQDLSALLKGAPPVQISRLSSSLSHEIRNPLSSVKMAVQTLARNTGLSERDQRRLTIAQREIRTIERMLWMLSEYGRDTPAHLEVVPVRSLLQQALEMIDRELQERQAQVDIQEAPETPKVRADTGRVRPVLAQLLLNVAIGREPGHPVSVRVRPLGGSGALEIDDPASALLPGEEATLFEPFGSRLARGAGLSLAALRQVMLRQGGQVTAQAGETGGTVFILAFSPA